MMNQCVCIWLLSLLALLQPAFSASGLGGLGCRLAYIDHSHTGEGTTTSTVDASPLKKPLSDDSSPLSTPWGPILLRRNKPSFDIVPLPKPKTKRHKTRLTTKSASKKARSSGGTRFALRAPSSERIARWFAPSDEGSRQRAKAQVLFNHDSVGMTNPVLSISLEDPDNNPTSISLVSSSSEQLLLEMQDSSIPASTQQQQQSPDDQDSHWTQVLQQHNSHNAEQAWFPSTRPNASHKWRQCRYRRRVGQGQACYERVRDAALEWQFENESSSKGILPVQGNKSCFSCASSQVQPIWSGPHTGGSRRLVTYTTSGFKSQWLPKLYTLNPVMVVYDLLDQRGPATTYTSTAYATLKGHLLRGEERVTVALRDGTGFVDVEILSYSRPGGSVRAKCVWPLIGRMQNTFFENQMDHLEQVALPPVPPPPPAKH